ncbi:MAG: phosphatidylserine decarboxylase [Pseudomonadota bacterium]
MLNRLAICIVSLSLVLSGARAFGQNPQSTVTWSPVVKELVDLVHRDPALRDAFEAALTAQEEGAFWHGKTLNDMYRFLEEWRTFSPGVETVMKYGDPFKSLYSRSNHGRPVPGGAGSVEQGYTLVRNPAFRAWMTRFVSARKDFLDSRDSAPVVNEWIKSNGIDMSIYQIPEHGFASFNDFFTRELKPNMRPVSAPGDDKVVTSPADCSLSQISSRLTADATFEVKGDEFNAAALLDDAELAKWFEGGQALLCFLMPASYHRFHAPISGKIQDTKQLAGLYFGARGFVDHFFEHRRGYYIIDNFTVGLVGLVAVGMGEISSVNMPRRVGEVVKKGDEIGYFAYGGSAIVLLFEPGHFVPLAASSPAGGHGNPGENVKTGNVIGSAAPGKIMTIPSD